MQFKELSARAEAIRQKYQNYNELKDNKSWSAAEYAQGLAGDFGDLSKLILAKNGYREIADIDAKLRHELADCVWSLFAIAHEFNIDLETSFLETMSEIEQRIS